MLVAILIRSTNSTTLEYCSMFTVYITTYLGEKLPPFYIGSTTFEKIANGYHGSVTSRKYRDIWRQELNENPHLFITKPIPNAAAETAGEIVEIEAEWQRLFDVVKDPDFINQSFAAGGFHSTRETALAAVETRRKNDIWHTEETKRNISEAKKGIATTIHTQETKDQMSRTRTGRTYSLEHRAAISAGVTGKVASEETREKLRESHLGIKPSAESIAKRLATIEARGGYSHSDQTKTKIGDANRGRKLPPKSAETRAKSSAALTGRKRSPEATAKMHATYERKRLDREMKKGK